MKDIKYTKVEEKIIDWIALGSGGRLVAFKQEGDILVVEKKGDYSGKKLFFKVTDSLQENLPGLYYISAHFDEIKQKLDEEILISANGKKPVEMNSKEFNNFLIDALLKK